MVFSSSAFLFLFLPIVLLVVYPAPRSVQNWLLLGFSAFFYLWGAGSDIIFILFVAFASWALALFVGRCRGWSGRLIYGVSIAIVITPLLLVKYIPVLEEVGNFDVILQEHALPLGISFFTFHALSYLIDVRRGDQKREFRIDHYFLYLFLFPHQIAGPIVRYGEIREEIKSRLRPRTVDVLYGLSRFSWGLAKKVVIADACGLVATTVWDEVGAGQAPAGSTAWIAALAFTFQIYFDFSGYSDMAIGLARVFSFHFPENFAGPYRSASATDFWRRWHMTLSRWFRDYVYIPLGGSRHGRFRGYLALIVTFTATSLWHGATWPFLVWGGLWSLALIIERMTGLRDMTTHVTLRRAAMMLFIVFTWVPFRAPTMEDTFVIWEAMVTGPWEWPSPTVILSLTPVAIMAMTVGMATFFLPDSGARRIFDRLVLQAQDGRISARACLIVGVPSLAVGTTMAMWGSFSPFLYFQF